MSERLGYGQRRIRVTPVAFEAWLVNEKRVTTDLPDDARFLDLWPPRPEENFGDGTYTMLFESSEWGDLAEGEEIPVITPTVEDLDDE